MGLNSAHKVWKKDETAAIVALYETERCLYDTKHVDYANPLKKRQAYERIHEVMLRIRPNSNILDIKRKIISLQKQYTEELLQKNIAIKAGLCTPLTYKPTMWCFGLMQFLDPYLPNKNSPKTISSVEEVNDNSAAEETRTKPKQPVLKVNGVDKNDTTEIAENVKRRALEDEVSRSVAKKKKVDSTPSPNKSVPKVVEPAEPIDREDIFGQYVASEMKGLKENPLLYLQTKQTILEILTSANFEFLNPE